MMVPLGEYIYMLLTPLIILGFRIYSQNYTIHLTTN